MNELPRLIISFQGKPISRLEFTYFQESRFMVNLDLALKAGSPDLELVVTTDDEWLIADPPELSMKAGGSANLSVNADSRAWNEPGDHPSAIRFSLKSPDTLLFSQELPVLIHHVTGQEEKEKNRFLKKNFSASHYTGADVNAEESAHHCGECGASLPDKRPLCAACRKARAQAEESEKKGAWKKDYRDSLSYFRSFMHTHPVVWTALALVMIVLIISALALSGVNPHGEEGRTGGSGSLSISSEPPGAWVIFLENEHSMTMTPLKISSLPAGMYKIHLQMENCGGGDILHQIEIKPHRENFYNFRLEKQGKLTVRSIPPGMRILVDGKETGKETPAQLDGISTGPHRVTLFDPILPEKALVFPITVEWGEEAGLFSVMNPSRSGVSLLCEPGARVYIDGTYCGKTPLPPMMVRPGLRFITVLRDRCLPWRQKLPFAPGEVMELAVDPVRQAELTLEGDGGGTLYINDNLYGTLPGKVLCTPGEKIKVKVVAMDGRAWKRTCILKPGEYRRERVKFPPAPVLPKTVAGVSPGDTREPLIRGSFFSFDQARFFPPRSWKAVETLYHDVDGDGSVEMLMVVENLKNRSSAGYPLFLFAIKKRNGDYELYNLRGPHRGAIGAGEILSLFVLRSDDFGYREVQYVCGDRRGKVTSKGSFVIYKGKLNNPSWSARAIE